MPVNIILCIDLSPERLYFFGTGQPIWAVSVRSILPSVSVTVIIATVTFYGTILAIFKDNCPFASLMDNLGGLTI